MKNCCWMLVERLQISASSQECFQFAQVVVLVVVVSGLICATASCIIWKRRKNHLKDKMLTIPAPSAVVPDVVVHPQQQQQPIPPPSQQPFSPPAYQLPFREGLVPNSRSGSTPVASSSCRSESIHHHRSLPGHPYAVQRYPLDREIAAARYCSANSPRPKQRIQRERGSGNSNSTVNGSGGRTLLPATNAVNSKASHRSNRLTRGNERSLRINRQQNYYVNPYNFAPAEARSLTSDTSFHSDSFYPDYSAHPYNIRLPHPSLETSLDKL